MPKTGHFILHSHVMPKLTAGKYDLVTEQEGLPFKVAAQHTHITVAAPRYTMPTDQILSTFPPANADGAFGDRLPQIVLKRRTLPWERNPAEEVATSPKPWLALVVVAEGEGQLSVAKPVVECVTPGTVLLDRDDKDVEQGLYLAVTETVVGKIFPCEEDLALLVHVREVDVNDTELANGDDDGWLAVVMANRLPVFDTANAKPVRYMACLVNIEGQLAALPKPQPPEDHFRFDLAQDWSVLAAIDSRIGPDSRVMGGVDLGGIVLPSAGTPFDARPDGVGTPRAPAPGAKAAASPFVGAALDGGTTMKESAHAGQWRSATEKVASAARDPDAKWLVRDTMAAGFRYPIETFAMEKVLRFPVLAHWSFTTSEGATFESLMQDIDVGLLGTVRKEPRAVAEEPAAEPLPPAPPHGPEPEVVETGHLGLGHRTRRGDATRAWYRGPMVPFPTERDQASGGLRPLLAHSADQLRRVVPDGREDLALAAAFEIGRLLALSQLSVVSALLRFRKEQFGAGRMRELLAQVAPFAVPELVDMRVDLGRFVAMGFVDELVKNPDTMIGPRRPVADPGREIGIKGDLDEVIAVGLGMDLGAVRKMAERVGVVAAVAGSAVPVAPVATEGHDERALAGLRGALDSTLQGMLEIAAPRLRRQTPGGRAGAARNEPVRDALDDLLERLAGQDRQDEEDR
jgi:hypothetical protein